jgi:PAS domain S-box-containing protein
MTIFDQVFYFYGRLNDRGVLLELKGKAFADAPDGTAEAEQGKRFRDSYFFQNSSENPSQDTPSIIQNAITESLDGKIVVIEADLFLNAAPQKIKLTFTPVQDDNNNIKEIFFAAQDITEYVSETAFYKQRSEQLLYAAENADIGLWFWDLGKEDIFTTPKLNEFFGLGPDEIMTSEKANEIIHPDDRRIREDALERARTNHDPYNIEYRVIVNGETRWLLVGGKTFPGSATTSTFMMGSARDITHQKISQEELRQISISEKKARDSIEEAIKAKDQFIAMVSHELRGPLNSILGWVKILLTKDVDEKATRNALETIERSARVQAKLINDLVDSSKIISGKLNLEFHPVNVVDAVAFVIESQKPLAEAKNIRLKYSNKFKDIRVNADLARVQQIFSNLITNAIKFTPDGGEISVKLERENDQVSISVTDNGKGIDAEALPHIFDQFFQARVNESGDKSGLGLGLSIVSTLIRQHGGRVKADSDGYGKGATFVVSFPVIKGTEAKAAEVKEKAAEAADAAASDEPLRNVRILLVEDNEDSREVLEIFMSQLGAEVTSAESVAEALEKLAASPALPHVLVSDISMPEEDGYSLITRIRKMPPEKGGSMPAIALTAFASNEDKRKILTCGFQKHHAKPFEPEILIKEILEVIG